MAHQQEIVSAIPPSVDPFRNPIPWPFDAVSAPQWKSWKRSDDSTHELRVYAVRIPSHVRYDIHCGILPYIPTQLLDYGLTMTKAVASLCAAQGWPVACTPILEQDGTQHTCIENSSTAYCLMSIYDKRYREMFGWDHRVLDNGHTISLTGNLRFAMFGIEDYKISQMGMPGELWLLARIKEMNRALQDRFKHWIHTNFDQKRMLRLIELQIFEEEDLTRFAEDVKRADCTSWVLSAAYDVAKTGQPPEYFHDLFKRLVKEKCLKV